MRGLRNKNRDKKTEVQGSIQTSQKMFIIEHGKFMMKKPQVTMASEKAKSYNMSS